MKTRILSDPESLWIARLLATPPPLPDGAEVLGLVMRGESQSGAAVRLRSGTVVDCAGGTIRSLGPLVLLGPVDGEEARP